MILHGTETGYPRHVHRMAAGASADGQRISLFAWMTVANGDATALANAQTQAVAGKLNRQRIWVNPGEGKPIRITCWPQGTTSDISSDDEDGETIVVTGSRIAAVAAPPPPPPPPPPAAAPERDKGVTGSRSTSPLLRVRRSRLHCSKSRP